MIDCVAASLHRNGMAEEHLVPSHPDEEKDDKTIQPLRRSHLLPLEAKINVCNLLNGNLTPVIHRHYFGFRPLY